MKPGRGDPARVVALWQDGVAQQRAGRLAQAEPRFREILKLAPDHAGARHLLGVTCAGLGRVAEAETILADAVRRDGADPVLRNNHGKVLATLGRIEAAVAQFEQALAVRPDYAEALANLGVALKRLGRLDAALARLDAAVALRPASAEAWCNHGSVLTALDRPAAALASLDRALALRPDYAVAHANRGTALSRLQKLPEAAAAYERALSLQPDHAEVLSGYGAVLGDLGNLDRALACIDRAIALKPDHADAHANRGLVLCHANRTAEARASYAQAMALRPESADYARGAAYPALLEGDFAAGWRLYEHRWQARGFPSPARPFAQPQWRGESLDGRRLLLHAEQGFGDTIQFCRYAALAAGQGDVVLEVPRALLRLLGCLNIPLVAAGDALPPFDLHCPLMSLPLVFGTDLATVPAPLGYLRADPALAASWAPHLGTPDRPRVGIVWSGRQVVRPVFARAVPLAAMLALRGCGATLHALQSEVYDSDAPALAAAADVVRLGAGFSDFADTAAVIAQLDLVISVDTSLAHLAAALGVPAWVLLTHAPEWRWLQDRTDSPWYPTVRLFRQTSRGDWDGVIARVAAALRGFGAGGRGAGTAGLLDSVDANRADRI